MILQFFQQIFEKHLTIKFHEHRSRGNRVIPCGHTDGRTWTKRIVAFRISAEVLKVTAYLKIPTCFPHLFDVFVSNWIHTFQCRYPSTFPNPFHSVLPSVMWKSLSVLFPNVSHLSPLWFSSYHKKIMQKGPPYKSILKISTYIPCSILILSKFFLIH
jgi:hypothetical protein